MTEMRHDQEHGDLMSPSASTSRRRMLRGHFAAGVAFAAAMLSGRAALAAPRPPCILRGTKILTTAGERRIEDIAIGDVLLTVSGEARAVQWIGRWHCRKPADRAWDKRVRPVRVSRSAIAPGVPHEDIYVSQGHALFIGDLLVPAGSLVNGRSIAIDDASDANELEYFHIKLATHDVIYAAGMPCETLLRLPEDALALLPEANRAGELRQATHCAPVVMNGMRSVLVARLRTAASPLLGPQKLDIIRSHLEQRAASAG